MADEQDKKSGKVARVRARIGGWVALLWDRLPQKVRFRLASQARLWREEPWDEARWRWQQLGRFVQAHYVTLIFAFLIGLILGGFDGLGMLGALIRASNEVVVQDGDFDATKLRDLFIAFAAFFGAPFFLIRAWIAERQTKTSEEGQMTDRIAKSVEQLGAEKTVKRKLDDGSVEEVTEPNLEVRLGGIFALERISQDSARDHWQVMEILTAYVRENGPLPPQDMPEPGTPADVSPEDRDKALRLFYQVGGPLSYWLDEQKPPRIDLQTSLTVISRRMTSRRLAEMRSMRRLDLSRSVLLKANLGEADLRRANLSGSDLSGANLNRVDFYSADLEGASLAGADLENANLVEASLIDANLVGANLGWANLTGANLIDAKLIETDLMGLNARKALLIEANLTGANLSWANLDRADLAGANLTEANLLGASLVGVDLIGANLVGANLARATLEGVNLFGADMKKADIAGANLAAVDLSGADLTDANLSGLSRTTPEPNLADLLEAAETGTNLTAATLAGTKLAGASFFGADLHGADLGSASGLSEAFGLRYARNVDEAALPEGWSVAWNDDEDCWDIETPDGPYVDPDERAQEADEG